MTYNKQYRNYYYNCLGLYYAMRFLSLNLSPFFCWCCCCGFLSSFSYYFGELKRFDPFIFIRLWIDPMSNLHELCTFMLKWLFGRLSRLDQICNFSYFPKENTKTKTKKSMKMNKRLSRLIWVRSCFMTHWNLSKQMVASNEQRNLKCKVTHLDWNEDFCIVC